MKGQEFTPSCPERIVEFAADHLGRQAWNPQSRTRLALERECAFVIGVWVKKYGPLSARQERYGWRVFEWAISDAARSARTPADRFSHLTQNFRRIANEERVHDGMMQRAALRQRLVDTDGLMVAA